MQINQFLIKSSSNENISIYINLNFIFRNLLLPINYSLNIDNKLFRKKYLKAK